VKSNECGIGYSLLDSALKSSSISTPLFFLPTFILYIFLSEKIIESVTAGAIKG